MWTYVKLIPCFRVLIKVNYLYRCERDGVCVGGISVRIIYHTGISNFLFSRVLCYDLSNLKSTSTLKCHVIPFVTP